MAEAIHTIRWWCDAIYLGWFCVAMLIGIPWLIIDEWRFRKEEARIPFEDRPESQKAGSGLGATGKPHSPA